MSSKPKKPEPILPPAQRPERSEVVAPEDIILGAVGEGEDEAQRTKGKRALIKPRGLAPASITV